MKRLAVVAVLLVLLVSIPKGQTEEDDILDRFLSRESTPVVDYVAIREISASNVKYKMSGEMRIEARLHNRSLSYRVLSQTGSGFILGKVLGGLNDEVEETAKLNPERVAFTEKNYSFTPAGEVNFDLHQLFSKPRRKEHLLIDGSIFVTPTGDLVRVEGRLVKNPKLLVRNVYLTRVYDKIMGVTLPVYFESEAQIPLAGPSNLTMIYHYLSVNGKPVTETN